MAKRKVARATSSTKAGEKEQVVIPVEVYERLLEAWEDLEDIRAYDEAKAEGGETIPLEKVKRELGLSGWPQPAGAKGACSSGASGAAASYCGDRTFGHKPSACRCKKLTAPTSSEDTHRRVSGDL